MSDPLVWINSGRECLGRIYAVGRGFRAELDDGTALGRFPTIEAARTKILFRTGDRLLERRRRGRGRR